MPTERPGALALKVLSEMGLDFLPRILNTLHSRDIGRLDDAPEAVYKKTMFLHVFLDFCGSLVLGFRVSCLFGGGLAPPCFPVNGQKTSCLGSVLDPIWGWATRTPASARLKNVFFSEGNRHFSAAGRSPNPILSRPELILSHSKSISLSFLTSSLLVFSRFFHLCSHDQYDAAMPRVGQLRLGRAAPALCGAPAASQPPRAARGGHSQPHRPAARRCTTPPHPSLMEMGRPLPERSRRPRSAGLQSPGSWTLATGSLQRRASTRPPRRGSTPLLRAPVLPKCTALAPQPPRASKRRRIRRPDPAPFRPRRRRAGRP